MATTMVGYDGLPLGAEAAGVPGIDPTADEAFAMDAISKVFTWCGIGQPLQATVATEFGNAFLLMREVVLVPLVVWLSVVRDKFSVADQSRLGSLRRISRLRMGLAPGEISPAIPASTAPSSAAGSTTMGVTPAPFGELKLADLVDQSLRVEFGPHG